MVWGDAGRKAVETISDKRPASRGRANGAHNLMNGF
jgi:hypothetical protein